MCFPPGKKLLQTSKEVQLPYFLLHKPPQQPKHQWECWGSPLLPELEQLPSKWLWGLHSPKLQSCSLLTSRASQWGALIDKQSIRPSNQRQVPCTAQWCSNHTAGSLFSAGCGAFPLGIIFKKKF